MMAPEIAFFLEELDQQQTGGPVGESPRQADEGWVIATSDDQLEELFAALLDRAPLTAAQDHRVGGLLRALLARPWDRSAPGCRFPSWVPLRFEALYRELGTGSAARAILLQLLATQGDRELRVWTGCLVEDPPHELRDVFLAFAPLFRRLDFDPGNVFPRLFDGLSHRRLAASIMDLSNYATEADLARPHPAAERRTRMVGLLGELTQGLSRMEDALGGHEGNAAQLAATIEDSVALAVALCRTLALIGDPIAIGKLHQALELRHRRLRVEAAASLWSLGEERGLEALAELAAEPVVRQRVLAYAEETGCLHRIDARYLTFAARAEADLAWWLAQPSQVGIPPTRLEVVDQRRLQWPGFEDELDCCLIRFTYQLAEGSFSNIGLVGPLTHAFAADLGDLPPDDIYAAFAGWHAEHEEIYEQSFLELSEAQRVEVARLERRMRDAGLESIRPVSLAHFFGERALVARAVRDRIEGLAVADLDRVDWWSTQGKQRPLSPEVAYCITKGRKLLRSFNEPGEE